MKKEDKYRIVYSLGEHPYLGFLLEPHAVLLNPNGELSFTHRRLFTSTAVEFDAILDDTDRELIRLLDEIEQSSLIRRFHKKAIRPADFFAKVFNDEVYEFLRPKIEDRMLKAMDLLKDKPLYLMGSEGYPADQALQIASSPASVLFHFRRNEHETRYFPTIKFEGKRIEFMYRDAQIIINKQAWMLLDQVLYYFDEALEGKKLSPFLQKRYIAVPRSTERKYFEMFVCGLIERHHVYAEGFDIRTYQHEATPILKTVSKGEDSDLQLELHFQYGPYLFPSVSDTRVTVRLEYVEEEDRYVFNRIRRSLQWEAKKKAALFALGLLETDPLFGSLEVDPAHHPHAHTLSWLHAHSQQLKDQGFHIVQESDGASYFLGDTSLSLMVDESNDWFDIHAMANFGEHAIPFLDLREYILSGQRSFILPNGEVAIIPEEWFARYPQLFKFSESKSGIRLKKHHMGLLDEISNYEEVTIDRKLEKLVEFEGMDTVPLPSGFRGTLRTYQQAGLNWFYFLKKYGFGGCLADDMGLGKTIQTLALLQHEKELAEKQGKSHTSLIIMPTSLIYNWQEEAAKFTPKLKIYTHQGMHRTKEVNTFHEYDVVITTYGVGRVDAELLQQYFFHYIILDESQTIKNPTSKTFKMVRDLQSSYRLVLTGTPIENTVGDLWTQMSFLNPGLLGSHRYFQQEFVQPIEKKKDEDRAARLQALIKPFVLRRTKEQVATELPPKSEQIIYCEMTSDQEALYERTKSEYRNTLLDELSGQDDKPGGGTQIAILQGLSKLRQLANHPTMIDPLYTGDSGKFEEVLLHLDQVLQRGHKVLIFSQFVRQLVLYKQYFDDSGIAYSYMDGATVDRAKAVDRFREDEQVRVFLISLKAGGVGLNLTEADYVFVLDPWWNPAVEQQAIDRAHRIGQKNSVFIYKFISKGTVEEKIVALQNRKSRIAKRLITTEESFFKSLDMEDIRALLA